jgi:hypothetical protein
VVWKSLEAMTHSKAPPQRSEQARCAARISALLGMEYHGLRTRVARELGLSGWPTLQVEAQEIDEPVERHPSRISRRVRQLLRQH